MSQPNPVAAQSEELQPAPPLVQVQASDLLDRFEGWELRYQIHGPYNQAFPDWARLVVAALRERFPGATVIGETVAGMSAPTTVRAPEGTPEQQVAGARTIALSVEDEVARRVVQGNGSVHDQPN